MTASKIHFVGWRFVEDTCLRTVVPRTLLWLISPFGALWTVDVVDMVDIVDIVDIGT